MKSGECGHPTFNTFVSSHSYRSEDHQILDPHITVIMAHGKRSRDASTSSDEEMESTDSMSDLSSSEHQDHSSEQVSKRQQLDGSQGGQSSSGSSIRCSLPPHAEMDFSTYDAYEIHHQQYHLHRCSECHRNFPSDHYLQLHISENHDPITAVKRDRGERTVCYDQVEAICRNADVIASLAASWRIVIVNARRRRNVECI